MTNLKHINFDINRVFLSKKRISAGKFAPEKPATTCYCKVCTEDDLFFAQSVLYYIIDSVWVHFPVVWKLLKSSQFLWYSVGIFEEFGSLSASGSFRQNSPFFYIRTEFEKSVVYFRGLIPLFRKIVYCTHKVDEFSESFRHYRKVQIFTGKHGLIRRFLNNSALLPDLFCYGLKNSTK